MCVVHEKLILALGRDAFADKLFSVYQVLTLYTVVSILENWYVVVVALCSGGAAHVIKQFSQILFCFFSRSKLFLSWFICCLSKTGGPANYAYKLWSSENHQIKTCQIAGILKCGWKSVEKYHLKYLKFSAKIQH